MKMLIISLLLLSMTACSSAPNTGLADAEWSCANQQLAEYERRAKDEYIKVRCKE